MAHVPATLFDQGGTLTNEKTRAFLRGYVEAFAAWIARVASR